MVSGRVCLIHFNQIYREIWSPSFFVLLQVDRVVFRKGCTTAHNYRRHRLVPIDGPSRSPTPPPTTTTAPHSEDPYRHSLREPPYVRTLPLSEQEWVVHPEQPPPVRFPGRRRSTGRKCTNRLHHVLVVRLHSPVRCLPSRLPRRRCPQGGLRPFVKTRVPYVDLPRLPPRVSRGRKSSKPM